MMTDTGKNHWRPGCPCCTDATPTTRRGFLAGTAALGAASGSGFLVSCTGASAQGAVAPRGGEYVIRGGYLITMRNNMIGQLGEDHVVMGLAKGLTDRRVRYNYAARNAMLPSVTAFALTIGAVMGGSLVTEVVFNYPGVGRLLYVAIVARDYPLIQGQLLIMTLAMLTANLVVDLAYVFLDPRLRKA